MGTNSTSMRDRTSEGHRVEGAGAPPPPHRHFMVRGRREEVQDWGEAEGNSKPYG